MENGIPQNITSIFIHSLFNALNANGIAIFQLGAAPSATDPPHRFVDKDQWKISLLGSLEKAGFESIHIYEDGNCGLHVPWTFLVVMKSDDSQNMWYRTEAQLAVNIHDRIVPTHDGLSPMKYFDSAQMQAYIYPHHIYEIEFCRQQPLPESCQILVEELEYTPNVQLSALEVRKSGAGKHSG
eukprot:744062_1